jgi:hypothetical protein
LPHPHPLPTRRRKDSDTENDRQNGLRMKNENTMTEKRFSFFADPQKEKRYAFAQLAHCLLPDTQANASQKSKSQFFLTHNLKSMKTNRITEIFCTFANHK